MTDRFVMAAHVETNVLAWRVLGHLRVVELPEIVSKVMSAVEALRQPVKLLVDNRYMMSAGKAIVFTADVTAEWSKLQQWLLPRCSHVAVMCNGSLMKLQMDRLATRSGLISVLKSFVDTDHPDAVRRDAYAFLGIAENPLIDQNP